MRWKDVYEVILKDAYDTLHRLTRIHEAIGIDRDVFSLRMTTSNLSTTYYKSYINARLKVRQCCMKFLECSNDTARLDQSLNKRIQKLIKGSRSDSSFKIIKDYHESIANSAKSLNKFLQVARTSVSECIKDLASSAKNDIERLTRGCKLYDYSSSTNTTPDPETCKVGIRAINSYYPDMKALLTDAYSKLSAIKLNNLTVGMSTDDLLEIKQFMKITIGTEKL